jgi:hypothetical protein
MNIKTLLKIIVRKFLIKITISAREYTSPLIFNLSFLKCFIYNEKKQVKFDFGWSIHH